MLIAKADTAAAELVGAGAVVVVVTVAIAIVIDVDFEEREKKLARKTQRTENSR